jgi:hypothetical protein
MKWYLSLLDGSIKTMDRLEEAFLKIWSIKEDPNMLLTQLNNLSKYENESYGNQSPTILSLRELLTGLTTCFFNPAPS